MDYKLELAPSARRDLKSLPINVQKDIASIHLPTIASNPFLEGTLLSGALRSERSYHFGRKPEYRIIYFILKNKITVTIIGTREGIYKKAKHRYN
jgi:mRNA-degrading endonuclease RelE of RelBE toxin-antitoxin system